MLRALVFAAALALASPVVPAMAREIEFAGHAWYVRDYPGGPGPNHWSADDVYVDDEGLHLFIGRANGMWTSSEVVMLGPPLGFGTYEFEVAGALDTLDRNVVLGLFNFPESDAIGPSGTNEIDIEITPWGDRHNPNRLNWTVYPPALGPAAAEAHRPLALSGDASTHRFIWAADQIDYAAYEGYPDGAGYSLLHSWIYAPADPATHIPQVPLVVHINLWLLDGVPEQGKPVELVIRNFRFTPAM